VRTIKSLICSGGNFSGFCSLSPISGFYSSLHVAGCIS
jgi:hypothetical protein